VKDEHKDGNNGISIDISMKTTVDYKNKRIRLDVTPCCTSMIIEADGRVHE
jgi:hypothetical protein